MEHILEKENMDAIKALSDVNIKVSEAKNLLFKLQEEETEYLVQREEKALSKINKVLVESKDLLDKTHQNYESIHEFCRSVSGYAEFLTETYNKFQKLLEIFKERNEIWDKNAKHQDVEFANLRKLIENDTKAVEEREKRVAEETKSLQVQREQIESRQQALLVSYKVEKDLWDQIQSKKN